MDLTLNNLQRLICHKPNQPNQTFKFNRDKNVTIYVKNSNIYEKLFRQSNFNELKNLKLMLIMIKPYIYIYMYCDGEIN